MAIKRGVSLYSYQQAEFFGQMTWKDQLREVATNLNGADGIEIISEATIPHYPLPPESFYYEWNNEMARWGLKAVTMDAYLDVLQFRDHVMTHEEAAERIKIDLQLAKKMGFSNVRLVHQIPFDTIELVLPLAEKLDIRMTNEVHAPMTIKPTKLCIRGIDMGRRVSEDVAFIQRTGTMHYGLQPDFGLFTYKPREVRVLHFLRSYMADSAAQATFQEMMQHFDAQGREAAIAFLTRASMDCGAGNQEPFIREMLVPPPAAQPEDLYDIAPYIICCHGKCWDMVEIPGVPDQFEESSTYYAEPIEVLKGIGYDGYINTEFEGQRSQQDQGDDHLVDEVVQVRRHQEMLRRLIGQ